MTAPKVPLGDVVQSRTGIFDPRTASSAEFTYVDIAAVDSELKCISSARKLLVAEAPSRARKLIRAGDVLVSTVRPNLNAVAMVPADLDGQVASTGFCVLRASERVLPRYLFFFARSPTFVAELTALVSGALYPAVSDSQVLAQRLPLPNLREQERQVDVLSRAEGILRLRREAQRKAAELIPTLFLDRFGDPASNPKGWRTASLGQLVSRFEGGKNIQAGDEGDSPLRILKISAVTSGAYRESESKPAPADFTPPRSHFVRTGDLLISRANTEALVGAVAMVEATNGRTLLPDKLWRFVWRTDASIEPTFAMHLLQLPSMRRALSGLASGTGGSMKNISQAKLRELQMVVPPMQEQESFAAHARSVAAIMRAQTAALSAAQATFDALLHQAFAT